MNIVVLKGRLTRDPNVRYTAGEKPMCVARFTLAVQRIGKENGADYPNLIAFGKTAESIDKYCKKGTEIAVNGRIQTGSYKNGEETIYTNDIVAERFEFCGTKAPDAGIAPPNGFSELAESEDLPF